MKSLLYYSLLPNLVYLCWCYSALTKTEITPGSMCVSGCTEISSVFVLICQQDKLPQCSVSFHLGQVTSRSKDGVHLNMMAVISAECRSRRCSFTKKNNRLINRLKSSVLQLSMLFTNISLTVVHLKLKFILQWFVFQQTIKQIAYMSSKNL